jgi:PhnB protein
MADYQQKGFHTVTPCIYGRFDLIDFLKRVFDAEERFRGAGSEAFHTEFQIGDSIVMAGIGRTTPAEFTTPAQWGVKPDSAPPPSTLYVYVNDVDATYPRALRSGATSLAEPVDAPWGDRVAGVRDSYGNSWWLATLTAPR